ncbi:MAG: dihydrolipoamide acetyltransferase family protein [Hyphomicrobiales bacterium]
MREFIIKMPDIGEGLTEAELVEWHVKTGDKVREDMALAAVMTDKATVEIPSPVAGTVSWLGAEVGETVQVKAPLVKIDTGIKAAAAEPKPEEPISRLQTPKSEAETKPAPENSPAKPTSAGDKPLASPAVRRYAQENGVDLRAVAGSGPEGRIAREDIDKFLARRSAPEPVPAGLVRNSAVEDIKLTGLRGLIAEKMALSASRIPHITYVEEIDMTQLEDLRAHMNGGRERNQPKLTILPFLMRAMVRAIAEQPDINATFDDKTNMIRRHGGVHIGVATQTPSGLTAPVVHHAEARDIWECAGEVARLANAARTGKATREELTGSTITISSLGALGGIVSTPIINYPEVAIIGVNRIATRPLWNGERFAPRKMMNLSSSFDHRIIDGFDAANFIQRLKTLLETPALIFIAG